MHKNASVTKPDLVVAVLYEVAWAYAKGNRAFEGVPPAFPRSHGGGCNAVIVEVGYGMIGTVLHVIPHQEHGF